ncbi:hypothetical protein [Fuscibacter oryzae]|uniref:Uncharacterized protein n=1 Tax=Fuscibacter oryzae TaxID=2803939 RepID=A0A8J7SR31_9RHOB|nr:hypothetical protein [Fuscibacter oryzae]MBL4926585.1 hypothetical protein [Fuscibacter oryzae]
MSPQQIVSCLNTAEMPGSVLSFAIRGLQPAIGQEFEVAMQILRGLEQESSSPVGFGLHVLLVAAQSADHTIAHRLAGLGGIIERQDELYSALDAIIESPRDYGLVVIDCDSFGGLERGQRAVGLLGEAVGKVPVILVSRECAHQQFPQDRAMATVLRAPLSAVAMRVGFEHALRDRMALREYEPQRQV